MPGLKSFLPVMAEAFGTTADALYSRQRALTQMELLPYVAGKGPGSGVPLTADSLGVMIIALMAAENLRDMDERVKRLCEASPDKFQSDETEYLALPTFRTAMEYFVQEYERIHLGGFEVNSVRVSPYVGQFVLTEFTKRGFKKDRVLKTKTYRVKGAATSGSLLVRTSELNTAMTNFAVRQLMNQFGRTRDAGK
jgi:hypothetical protein